MPRLLFQMIMLFLPPDASIQPEHQEEKIYTVSDVNVKPEPIKGLRDFQDRWMKKVKYPDDAIRAKIQGMVFIEFVVNPDGAIVDASIKTGIGHGCDEAALKGFLEVSKERWKPGIKDDRPVKVKMVQPFFFRLIEG